MEQFSGQSRNKVKSLLEKKRVLINGKVVSQFNHVLEPGQQVFIEKTAVIHRKASIDLHILFEDESLIVIEKPAGMLSVPTETDLENSLLWIVSDHVRVKNPNGRAYTVHRLDRGTSGVMLFCKKTALRDKMQKAWDEMVLERKYIAVVEGRVEKESGTLTSYLKENKALKMYSTQDAENGQKAVTHYKVLMKGDKYSMLEIVLETGRKNQIRVHMQDLGHPVCGDEKYGAKTDPLKRLGLHASVLGFTHPVTNEAKRFEIPCPKEFLKLFKA
jgi:23S rRNA pseudouridine1911/1915/1917 synthase